MPNDKELKITEIDTGADRRIFTLKELCTMIPAGKLVAILDKNGTFLYTCDSDRILFSGLEGDELSHSPSGHKGLLWIKSMIDPIAGKDVLSIQAKVGKSAVKPSSDEDEYTVRTEPEIEVKVDTTFEQYRSDGEAIRNKADKEPNEREGNQ